MRRLFVLFTLFACTAPAFAQQQAVKIANDLKISWPWDLTYIPVKSGNAFQSVQLPDGTLRPLQTTVKDGETRAWFVATLDKSPEHTVTLSTRSAAAGIQVKETKDHYLIDNGVYEFRLRKSMTFSTPEELKNVPHWNAGARLKGTQNWDGRTWFEGNAPVKSVKVTLIQSGPVFIDAHVVYEFETTESGVTEALPLELGKQTHEWEPNKPPREDIPKLDHAYEAKIRFVMGDPWIEVNERFHLPRDKNAGAFGIHQYWTSWGKPVDTPTLDGFQENEFAPVDTATWVRWFLYDAFGGNTNQNYVNAEPRPDQKGRPFALLRPRWNQGGGGAQDFIVTSGGKNPPGMDWILGRHLRNDIRNLQRKGSDQEKAIVEQNLPIAENEDLPYIQRLKAAAEIGKLVDKEIRMPAEDYSTENPAMGIIAAFASKWVGPYPATIAAYVYDNNRARARFPMIDGERSNMHYGQRAYALCIGPRSAFTNLNDLVRRHTDWTLVAQMNKYILDWERDPELAGPSAKITRKRLAELQNAYKNNRGTDAEIIRESVGELDALLAEREKVDAERNQARDLSRSKTESDELKEAAKAKEKELGSKLKDLDKKLSDSDMQLLRMITKDWRQDVRVPTAELWIQRRYQDDFLNPTQRTPRAIAEYATADLFSGGKPFGDAWNATLGYITTDLDSWPGWLQGWSPGNPNFHTDKYMGAIYIATAMRDHPHSKEWLAYGWDNFEDDLDKVLLAPDGAGYECPGYSGYSLTHQLGLAQIFVNAGFGNPVVENPLFKGTGRWHRKLITPYDHRIERRHAAPIGDTHRWDSGLGHGFGYLAKFYKEEDPAFASEMQGAWKLLTDNGLKIKSKLKTLLLTSDSSIPPMDPKEMDWSGEVFHGFGSLMRNNFGTDSESFLSMKAGPLRGHYHNDELAYHFYSNGKPISLDYNCSYHPRGDHAALHNSMTFGREGSLTHNKSQRSIQAMEQISATAWPGAFASGEFADVVVAEREQNGLSMDPLYPKDHEFNRKYPYRETDSIVHRRFLTLVKHETNSPFTDYLVVRDETRTSERQAVNIHLLARDAVQNGNLILADGQYDMDMAVYVAQASGLKVEHRSWSYEDEWMIGPGTEYEYRIGESTEDWAKRMEALKKKHGVDSIPLPGWKPEWKGGKEAESKAWLSLIHESEGKALTPPPGWNANWMYGEYQHWLRLNTDPGTPVLWVLYPYPKGSQPPTFESLDNGTGVRVTLNGKSEEIWLSTTPSSGVNGQAVIRRNGKTEVLLTPNTVPELGAIPHKPLQK
jgi:hypothetical protein